MRCLLDTHTFIWVATDDKRLSATATETVLDGGNALFLSVASIWEMSIKTSLGKLILTQPLAQIINNQIQVNCLNILNIESSHSLGVAALSWHHRDPFDRLLISQSMLEDMPIIGRDKAMQKYDVSMIW